MYQTSCNSHDESRKLRAKSDEWSTNKKRATETISLKRWNTRVYCYMHFISIRAFHILYMVKMGFCWSNIENRIHRSNGRICWEKKEHTCHFFPSLKLLFCALSHPIFHVCGCDTEISENIYLYRKHCAVFLDCFMSSVIVFSPHKKNEYEIGYACVTQLFQFHFYFEIRVNIYIFF